MIDILNSIPAWLWFVIGFILGFGSMGYHCLGKKHGTIHVTRGNAEKPDTYLFEFNIPPENIPHMKQVIFQVKISADS